MKKILLFILVSLMLTPNLSLAQSTSTNAVREKEQKRETIKSDIEARKQNVADKMKEQVESFIKIMKERFNAATERLDKLAVRIDSRIAKLEAEKIDVAKAKTLMTTAKTKIETAKTSVNSLIGALSSNASTTASVKGEYKTIKAEIAKIRDNIKAAHAALVDVVKNLKPGQNKLDAKLNTENEKKATTTKIND